MSEIVRPADDAGLVTYLQTQKIAVVSLPIDAEGTPHAAAVNFYNRFQPFDFYFVTAIESQKCTLLRQRASVAAAMVVGTYDHTDYSLQMRGQAMLVDHVTVPDLVAEYHAKRGNTNEGLGRPGVVLVRFVPDWARYIDYAQHRPPQLLAL